MLGICAREGKRNYPKAASAHVLPRSSVRALALRERHVRIHCIVKMYGLIESVEVQKATGMDRCPSRPECGAAL